MPPEEPTNEPVRSPGSLLAESLYDPKPAEGSAPTPPADPPSDPPSDPPTEPEGVEGSDPPTDPPTDPEGGEVEEVELQTLEELAEHFELDPEWLTKLSVTRKVNGKAVPVSIAEALDNLDKVKAADEYLYDADKRRNEIIAEAKQKEEQLSGTIATFSKLLESVEEEINRDVKAIDWKSLEEDDPGKAALEKQRIRERRDRLDTMKKEAQDAVKQSLASHQQQSEEAVWEDRRKRAPKEKEALMELLPEWKDEEKWRAEQDEAIAYMNEMGATPQQIEGTLYSAKPLSVIVKAMRYDKAKAKAGAARKRVVTVPKKVLKPGTSKDTKPNGKDKDDPVSILYG